MRRYSTLARTVAVAAVLPLALPGQPADAGSPFIGEFQTGVESWAGRLDDDDSNNFGFVNGFNTGYALDALGVDLQAGVTYGVYDLMGHEQGNEQDSEEQVFTTLGISRLADCCKGESFSYAVVWDYLHNTNVGEEHNQAIDLHQLRGRVGYALTQSLEAGVWGTVSLNDESFFSLNAGPINVQALDQASLYVEKWTSRGARVMGYLGYLEEPGEFVLGVNGDIPISDCWSLGGGFTWGKPSTSPGDNAPNGVEQSYSEQYWMMGFSLTYQFGGGCIDRQTRRLMPVANNGSFMVKAPVGAL